MKFFENPDFSLKFNLAMRSWFYWNLIASFVMKFDPVFLLKFYSDFWNLTLIFRTCAKFTGDVEKQILSLANLIASDNGLTATEREEYFLEFTQLGNSVSNQISLSGINTMIKCNYQFSSFSYLINQPVKLNVQIQNNSPGPITINAVKVTYFKILRTAHFLFFEKCAFLVFWKVRNFCFMKSAQFQIFEKCAIFVFWKVHNFKFLKSAQF